MHEATKTYKTQLGHITGQKYQSHRCFKCLGLRIREPAPFIKSKLRRVATTIPSDLNAAKFDVASFSNPNTLIDGVNS